MLPDRYKWLEKELGPKMVLEFLKIYGVKETIGPEDNPIIMEWAKELGLKDYIHDSIAWCGLEHAIVAHRAGKLIVQHPLWAANWLKFGTPASIAMLGYTLVFKRPGGNHVGLYIAEDTTCYHVGGGNQSDMVKISRIEKSRCIGIRKPPYSIAEPPNVRRIFVNPTGDISTNEA
jgi:uncharacterized protein (TIGR02594 family)